MVQNGNILRHNIGEGGRQETAGKLCSFSCSQPKIQPFWDHPFPNIFKTLITNSHKLKLGNTKSIYVIEIFHATVFSLSFYYLIMPLGILQPSIFFERIHSVILKPIVILCRVWICQINQSQNMIRREERKICSKICM